MSQSDAKRERYYRDGDTWEYQTYLRLRQSNKRAWIVAGVAITLCVLSLLALVLIVRSQALANYRTIFTRGHADNPVERYGYDSTVRVQIKSLQLLTDSTAQVRFQTVTTTRDRSDNGLVFGVSGRRGECDNEK